MLCTIDTCSRKKKKKKKKKKKLLKKNFGVLLSKQYLNSSFFFTIDTVSGKKKKKKKKKRTTTFQPLCAHLGRVGRQFYGGFILLPPARHAGWNVYIFPNHGSMLLLTWATVEFYDFFSGLIKISHFVAGGYGPAVHVEFSSTLQQAGEWSVPSVGHVSGCISSPLFALYGCKVKIELAIKVHGCLDFASPRRWKFPPVAAKSSMTIFASITAVMKLKFCSQLPSEIPFYAEQKFRFDHGTTCWVELSWVQKRVKWCLLFSNFTHLPLRYEAET